MNQRKPLTRRVHYYETDQMGIVHHSNYIRWFEEARTAYMDQNGIGYANVEAQGVQIPVVSVSCSYKTAVKFDQTIEIHTRLSFFNGVRAIYQYKIYPEGGSGPLLASGESEHCFIDAQTHTPQNLKKRLPEYYAIMARLQKEDE